MANEAAILELSGQDAVPFNCAATAISKGTLCWLSGDYMVKGAAADGAVYAGVAATDKDTGVTRIGLYVPGQNNIFDMKAGANTITLGGIVALSGDNLICQAIEAQMVTGAIIGKALEAATGSEVIRVLS